MRKEAIFIVLVVTLASLVSAVKLAEFSSLPQELVACENSKFSHTFDVSSEPGTAEADISPKELFFVKKIEKNKFEIFSDNLTKAQVGKVYERTIYAEDSNGLSYQIIKIKALEKNNPPTIEDVKVQTISLEKSSLFKKNVIASDIEDGNQDSGKLKFETRFRSGERLFGISDNGQIDFSADKSKIGVYLIEVCVRDSGLEKMDAASSQCGEDGLAKITCDEFQLAVTEKNRQPTIVSRNPLKEPNITAGNYLNFSLTTFDPDGTAADVYWYVDNNFMEFDSGISSLEKNFGYFFECGSYGQHEVKAEITDGLLNDSLIWKVNVQRDPNCTKVQQVRPKCDEKWACSEWNVCQHAGQSAQFGSLPQNEYQKILLDCNSQGLSQEACGFQTRNCNDVAQCNKTGTTPLEIQACNFVLSPSCTDKIKNCHDGSCEIGVDCGGNCGNCPSCFDKIKNQDEEGVDCGGNCENACPTKESIMRKKLVKNIAIGVVCILLIFIFFKAFKVIKAERELSKYAE